MITGTVLFQPVIVCMTELSFVLLVLFVEDVAMLSREFRTALLLEGEYIFSPNYLSTLRKKLFNNRAHTSLR